jgi:hypothetical protein
VRRVALAASVAAAFALMSARATADVTKDQCVDSNTNAQSLRRDGKFTAARRELVTCGNPSCPALVRDDCARRLDELERVQPSIVIDAKDGAGQDLAAVEVQVDGQTVADHLVGTALRVDPGSHVFTFTVAGKPSVTRTFVLKEGERDRREQVRIGAPADAASEVPAPVPGTGRSTLGLVVGGVGVVGLGVGSAFGLLALSATNQQKTDCASPTSCPHVGAAATDHKSAQTDGAISTAAFIAGGALLATGGILFFSAPHSEKPTTAGFIVSPGGGGIWLRGQF